MNLGKFQRLRLSSFCKYSSPSPPLRLQGLEPHESRTFFFFLFSIFAHNLLYADTKPVPTRTASGSEGLGRGGRRRGDDRRARDANASRAPRRCVFFFFLFFIAHKRLFKFEQTTFDVQQRTPDTHTSTYRHTSPQHQRSTY
jgi:hypothetical protein